MTSNTLERIQDLARLEELRISALIVVWATEHTEGTEIFCKNNDFLCVLGGLCG